MNTPTKVQLYTGLLLVGVFALGTLAGAGISQWSSRTAPHFPGRHGPPLHGLPHGPPPFGLSDGPPPFGPWSLAQLELSPEQEKAAHEVFEKYHSELNEVLREGFPKIRLISTKIGEEVRTLLDDEQKELFDSLHSKQPLGEGRLGCPPGPPPF